MLLIFSLVAEWQIITCYREALVNQAILKSNQQHINYIYFVGEQVLKYDQTIKGKLAVKISCLFEIMHFHVNKNVTIQLWVGVTEKINIVSSLIRTLSYNWRLSCSGGSAVPSKSITQAPISPFLGILRFHIPPNVTVYYPPVSC